MAASRKQCLGCPNENNEQHGANAKAPSDELFLDGEQRLGRHLAKLFADIRFFTCHGISSRGSRYPLAIGGCTPWKKTQEMIRPTHKTKPKRQTT